LLASLADLPSESWSDRLPKALRDATGGSPLLILETLTLLLEKGLLTRAGSCWITSDADQVFRTLTQGEALRRRVTSVGRAESWVLLVLAVSGIPLERDLLLESAAGEVSDVKSALATLEKRGLVLRDASTVNVAHDEHATAAIETASPMVVERAA